MPNNITCKCSGGRKNWENMKVYHALSFLFLCGSAVVATAVAVDEATSFDLPDEIASIAESDGTTLTRHDPVDRPTPTDTKDAASAPKGILERDTLTGDWNGARTKLEENGLSVRANLTAQYIKNLRGGVSTKGSSTQTLFNLNATLDLEKLLNWRGGTFFVNFQHQTGQSPGDEIGAIHGVSPIDADGRTQIAEVWYEQKLIDDKLRVKVGKIDVNTEFAVSELGSEFLNGGFSCSPNNPIPAFPDTAFGGMAVYNFADNLYIAAGVFDGASQSGIALGDKGPGTLFGKPSDLYMTAEAGGSWKVGGEMPGRAVIGLWHQTGTFEKFIGGSQKGTTGAYLVAEQMVWCENLGDEEDKQGLGLFFMYGFANSKVVEIPTHLAAGAVYHGLIPTRDADSIGLGVSYIGLEKDAGYTENNEIAIEAFYEFRPIPSISLKPDVQYIMHPGGNGAKDALAIGLNMNIDF